MEVFVRLLGAKGVISVIGGVIFFFSFKYSTGIFEWIERQTMGTREYILEKFDLLFIEASPEKVTYALLAISLGPGLIVFITFLLLGQWAPGFILASIVTFISFRIPRPVVDYLVAKRVKAYQSQMVDALQLLSNGIRAGLSVPQAIGMIVDELSPPISQEFNVILQQNRIGVPLEECFENLVKRVPIEDNEMFVSSINILRETGGNLAEVFDTIVDVIRERIRLQQKIETYTAQGMFQGATIFCMPFAIGAIFASSDPEPMKLLFTHPLGWVATFIILALDLAGGYLILKIVKIKV